MTKTHRVVITDFINGVPDPENRILGDLAEVVALCGAKEEDLIDAVRDADAIMVYHTLRLTATTIDELTRCKLIMRCGVGYDNIDHALARRRGIPVANVPDYGTEEVADSAIALAMALTRGVARLNSLLRSGTVRWSYAEAAPLCRLRGRVFGIVGLGRIGTAAALRAKALGMNVVFHDPYKPSGYEKALGIRRVESLEELLAQCHVLSLHCPLTEETFHLLDRRTIAMLPPGAYLVNTARGAVVDALALPEALASGQLAGAGIDVLEHEPPPADHPLIVAWRDPRHAAHSRLIINPHAAFYSEESLMDMRTKGASACRKALCGQSIPNVVN